MTNMRNNIFNWMKLSSFIFALSSLFASCSQEEMYEPATPQGMRFNVGDFPAYDNPQTRASINGTPDAGKTHWVENDEIIITVKSEKYGTQYATLTYNGEEWCFDDYLKYLESENEEDGTLEITALYAPCYEVLDDAISLKEGKTEGMDEYLEVKCRIENRGVLQIPFSQAKRNYSRIRIACASEVKSIFIAAGRFTPAGIEKEYRNRFDYDVQLLTVPTRLDVPQKTTVPFAYNALSTKDKLFDFAYLDKLSTKPLTSLSFVIALNVENKLCTCSWQYINFLASDTLVVSNLTVS